MSEIKICFTVDNNYAKYTGSAVASVLSNANIDDKLTFYIISSDITEENKEKINNLKRIKDFSIVYIKPKEDEFSEFKKIKTTGYLPLTSFYRLKLASYINEDKIIYLDPDIIVNTSLKELYNTNVEQYFMGAIADIGSKRYHKRNQLKQKFYVNSGVLLINLKKWRQENAEEIFINCAKDNQNVFILGDQDILNKAFDGKILKLDSRWNVQVSNYTSRSNYSLKFNILHYTGPQKPWKYGAYTPFKEYYFKYSALTDWETPDKKWQKKSNLKSYINYFRHRPLFIFRPGFIKAVYYYMLKK